MNPPTLIPRRRFLASGIAALGGAPMAWIRAQQGSPNDEIHMGIIGCGSMGSGNMSNFLNIPGIRVVAVCDLDAKKAQAAKAKVDGKYKNTDCKLFAHHEELLALPGLDAVCISTPDHWHARIGIDAANAGKDIYGEKPFTCGFADGRVIEVRSDFGGTKFTSEKGWIHVNRGKITASDKLDDKKGDPRHPLLTNLPEGFSDKVPGHHQNFIDCVRSRKLTVAHAEAAHRAASFGQLAIVAIDTKQPLQWDPKAEKVLGNPTQAAHPRLGARLKA